MKKKLALHFFALLTFFINLFFINSCFCATFFDPISWSNSDLTTARSTGFSYNGRYLAVGGGSSGSPYNGLIIYGWNGSTLTNLAQAPMYGASPTYGILQCKFSPDDKYIAAGGYDGASGSKSFQLYSWNGTTLSPVAGTTSTASVYIHGLSWHPTGKWIAFSGYDATTNMRVAKWDGTTFSVIWSNLLSGSEVLTCAWSNSGNYVVFGATTANPNILVYSFNGSTLSAVPGAQKTYGAPSALLATAWSPDDKYLAVGGSTVTTPNYYNIQVYSFNGTSLTLTSSMLYNCAQQPQLRGLNWTSDSKYLLGATWGATNANTFAYAWNGSTLSLIESKAAVQYLGNSSLSPDDMYFATANFTATPRMTLYQRFGSVDGVRKNIVSPNQWQFPNGGMAVGNVLLNNGFSLARSQTLDLDLSVPIYGQINLEYSSLINIKNDIHLGTGATLTSSYANISGNGKTIFLDGNFTTPDNTVLLFSSDTVIDGQNHILTLGHWSQILVDTAVTVTLKNMTIKNTLNTQSFPPLRCNASTSKLALDNIQLNPVNDFYFNQGQLYIHNDVIFTGTSQFIYKSNGQSFIAQNAVLSFEPNTSFYYYPVSPSLNTQLITMQDPSSTLYLNGCSLSASQTGLRLTKGQVFFDNNVTIRNNAATIFSSLSGTPAYQGTGDKAYGISWSPDDRFFATASANGTSDIQVFRWYGNGSNLIDLGPQAKKNFSTGAYTVAWSPNGKYLATGGINSPNDVIIYQWDGVSLIDLGAGAKKAHGSGAWSISWSPDGNYLVVGGNNGSADVIVYRWDGTTLTSMAQAAHGSFAYEVSWSPDGQYIAVAGSNGSAAVIIYQWNGSTIIYKTQVAFGSYASRVAWSPDSRYIAISGVNDPNDIIVYQWNGTNLIDLGTGAKKDHGSGAYAVAWSYDGRFLAAGGNNNPNDLIIYQWDGTNLNDLGVNAKVDCGTWNQSCAWSHSDTYIATGNYGYATIFNVNLAPITQSPAYTQSIFFGNSTLGANNNISINVLNNAKVTTYGKVFQNKT